MCIPFIGFLKAVERLLGGVRCVSGCSGGALVAAAWVLEIPDITVIRILSKHMARGMLGDLDVASLLDRLGLVDTEKVVGDMCREMLGEGIAHWRTIKKGWEPDAEGVDGASITMQHLAKLTGKSLAVGVCDASRGFLETFITAETHPDLQVWRALSASCAIPFAFTPVVVGDSVLCDACVRDGSPVRGIPGSAPEGMVDTLMLEVQAVSGIVVPSEGPPRDLLEFGKGVLAAMIERACRHDPQPRARVVRVPRWTENRMGPMVLGTDTVALISAYEHGVICGEDFLALVIKDA